MHVIVDARNLTAAEQELIRAAVGNQGVLEVATRAETHGRAVVAGRKQFFDRKDRSVAMHYISLLRLKELELIHEVANKKAYELTNFGWQLSRISDADFRFGDWVWVRVSSSRRRLHSAN